MCLKTERCICHLKLHVWREPLFMLGICEYNSSVIIRFEILLWLTGCENFSGPSRKGPQGRYHTSWIISGPKRYFMYDKRSEMLKSLAPAARRWIVLVITSELTNQSARKALFTCVVYTKKIYWYLIVRRSLCKRTLLQQCGLGKKNRQTEGVNCKYPFWRVPGLTFLWLELFV